MVHGTGAIRVPAPGSPNDLQIVAEGRTPGSRGEVVPSRIENGTLVLTVAPPQSGRWLYGVSAKRP